MVAPWTYRVVWPVEYDDTGYQEARSFAEADIVTLAEVAEVRIVGEIAWEMVEHDDPDVWPHTSLALVAVADAVPARPTREQLPAVVGWYAGRGFNDREIGRELGIPRDSVIYVRRRHNIPAGQVRAA